MIAGSLEIQLMADMSKLHQDMETARRITGNSMSEMESMMKRAQTAIDAMAEAEKARSGVFSRTLAETKRLLDISKGAADDTAKALENMKIDPEGLKIPPAAMESLKTWQEKSAYAIGGGVAVGVAKAKNLWDDFTGFIERQAVIWGVALAVGISAAIVGAVYTAFKEISFAVGLLTGESYKSVNIDALVAANKEVKDLQESLGLATVEAGALRQAMDRMGIPKEDYVAVYTSAADAIRKNREELDRLGIQYQDSNGKLLETQVFLTNVKNKLEEYTVGWERNQAAAAIGVGSYEKVLAVLALTPEKLAEAKARLDDFNLGIGPETQAAVAEHKKVMAEFTAENELTSQGFKRAIADNIMPLLTDLAAFFSGGFDFAVNSFRYSMATITSLLYGLKTVFYMVAESILGSMSSIGSIIGGVGTAAIKAASGDFSGAKDALVSGWTDAKARLGLIGDNIVAQARHNADAMRTAWAFDDRQGGGVADAGGKSYAAEKAAAEAAKAAATASKEWEKLYATQAEAKAAAIADLDAAYAKETATIGENQEKQIALAKQYHSKLAEIKTKFAAKPNPAAAEEQSAEISRYEEMARIYKLLNAELDDIEKAKAAYGEAVQALIGPLEAEAKNLEQQVALYGQTRAQIEATIIAQLEEAKAIAKKNGATEEAIAFYEREIEARKRIAAAAGNADELRDQTDFWKSIESTAHQTFVSIADGGKNTWQRLKETGKNIFFDWLYQMTAKKWLFNFAASASGTGVAQSAFGAQGGGGELGVASNALSLGNTLMGGSGSAFTALGSGALFGNTAFGGGLTLAGSQGVIGGFSAGLELLSTGGSSMAALGAMLPGIGTAIAAIALITSLMGKGGGPKTGGDSFLSFTGDTANAMTSSQLATSMPNLGGNSPGVGYFTPDNGNATASQLLSPAGASVAETIKSLGGTANGLKLGLGYDTDPNGTASSRVQSGVYRADGSVVYDHMRDVGRDADMTKEMTTELQRMTLGAISAADGIKPIFKAIVGGIDLMTASADQMTAALKQVTDAKTVLDYATADPFADYATAAATASQSLMQSWGSQQTALSGLLTTYDGSAAATAALADKTKTLYQTELAIAQQIDQLRTSFGASTDSSIRDYRMSTMDNQGKYGFLDQEAASYLQQIKDATDPAKIAQYSASLAADRNAAWGLLDDAQKRAHLEEFVQRARDDQTAVDAALDKASTLVQQGHQDLSNVITSAMDRAATALVDAANRISAAADKPVIVNVNATTTGNEVSYA